MLDLQEFTSRPVSNPTLFVTMRKRLGEDISMVWVNSCWNHCLPPLKPMTRSCLPRFSRYIVSKRNVYERNPSIQQPHYQHIPTNVHPIVYGKAKVKFGGKIGTSIVNGYTFIDNYSWESYNLMLHLRNYKKRYGCLIEKFEDEKSIWIEKM